jgi:predicted acyltransferase
MLPGDFIAPLFQFISGISLVISVNKRMAKGENATLYVIRRSILLLLVGLILDAGFERFKSVRWGVLQSISVGTLLGYLFLSFSPILRVVIGIAILSVYSIFFAYVPQFSIIVLSSAHGGLFGAISYATVTIFGTIAGEWLYTNSKRKLEEAACLGVALLLFSYIVNIYIPFNRLTVSASYMLFSAGFSFLLATLFYFISEIKHYENNILRLFGRNALSIWIAQYVFLWWPSSFFLGGGCCFLPWTLGLAATIMEISIFYVIADILDLKRIS